MTDEASIRTRPVTHVGRVPSCPTSSWAMAARLQPIPTPRPRSFEARGVRGERGYAADMKRVSGQTRLLAARDTMCAWPTDRVGEAARLIKGVPARWPVRSAGLSSGSTMASPSRARAGRALSESNGSISRSAPTSRGRRTRRHRRRLDQVGLGGEPWASSTAPAARRCGLRPTSSADRRSPTT